MTIKRFFFIGLFLFSACQAFALKMEREDLPKKISTLRMKIREMKEEATQVLSRLKELNSRYLDLPGRCDGRLTTESGVPFSTSDRTAQGTLYFTPYQGSTVSLYDGSAWTAYTFTEISLALNITSGRNYDVFLYNNTGTLTLEILGWTDDTTRAVTLTTVNGIFLKNGDTTRRFLGTIRASASNVTEDSKLKRYVWNHYHRLPTFLFVSEGASYWTTAAGAATWGKTNNSTSNRVEFVMGMPSSGTTDALLAGRTTMRTYETNNYTAASGIGVDSVSANSSQLTGTIGGSVVESLAVSEYQGYPSAGYHYLQWLEFSETGNAQIISDDTTSIAKSGLVVLIDD